MLALAFTFPSGRYHATPWDRHVNEGAVVWPPEPWRVLRALISTWHHKVKHAGKYSDSALIRLIEALSQRLPEYTLPAASHSHTRHYMPQWKAGDTSLVFDAFAAIDRDEPLIMAWKDLSLPESQLALLDDLLNAMGYLGRAESWVEARRVNDTSQRNCSPSNKALDKSTGDLNGEVVTLLAPLPSAEYTELREKFLPDKKAEKRLGKSLPVNLIDALSVETIDLRKLGWNQPPAARQVAYVRPVDALRPRRTTRKATIPKATTVRYLLIGKPLPRIEDSVRIGELLRRAVMSEAKRQLGEHAIPSVFSGHDLSIGNRHRHAFYLPWDANEDGHIDRLVLHVPDGMGLRERRIVERVRRLGSRDGNEWRLVLEDIGDGARAGGSLVETSMRWQSLTPYLHPWHTKKHFGIEEQIKRECCKRGLPEPISFKQYKEIEVGAQKRRTIHFHRFRSKRGLDQADRQGTFWRLTFPEAVRGPLALGFACHFGLGLFVSVGAKE